MCVGNKFRRITAMIMIIVMVVTSGGIHSFSSTFANTINEMNKSSKDLSHKYYDEMMEEKAEKESQEVIENEETEEAEDNSQEKTLGENENSENENSESDEGEDDKSEAGEEPEEDESTKEPEEDKTTAGLEEEPEEETEEEPEESEESPSISDADTDDEENKDKGNAEDKIEENETDEENIATDSDASDDADTTEEADATEDEIDNATKSELDDEEVKEASSSDADEVGVAEESKVATIATYSDLFTVATYSILSLEEATVSEMDKLLGGTSDFKIFSYTMKAPTYIVFGDVGYDTAERQTDQGYIGMYLGIDQGRDGKGDDADSEYVSSYSHRYYGGSAPHYISYLWKDQKYASSEAYRAGMMPPEYYAPVSWYVQSTADVGHFWVETVDEKGINEAHEQIQFEKLTPDEFRAFWDFAYNGKKDLTWRGGIVKRVQPYLHGVDCWRSGNDINSDLIGFTYEEVKNGLYNRLNKADIANQYNYQYKDFLTKNQNIRGYIIDEDKGAGNYKLKLVEGVKFNNDWAMKEIDDAVTAWSIEDIDNEITVWTAQSEWYDWRLRFKTSYYGIHIGQANTNINTHVHWRNGDWEYDPGKYSGTSNLIAMSDNSILEFTIPTSTKDVNYTDGSGNKYKLVGWTLEPHKYELRTNYFDGNGHDIRFVSKDLNENLKDNFETNLIWKPGETVKYKIPTGTSWPITFGPFYRQKFVGDGYKLVDGYRWGVGDKGANGVYYNDYLKKEVNGDYPNAWWSMITKAQRGNNTYNDFTDNPVHYNVLFLSPVLKKEVSKTATLHANGGTWTDTNNGEDKSITYNNFDSKSLPTSDSITRAGYTFKGWNTQADGNGTSYTTLDANAINNNVTELYAIWEANTYKFKYSNNKVNGSDGNEYTGGTEGSEFNGTYGKKITMPKAEDYALEGFTLLGFSDDASDTTGKFKPATEYTVNTTNFTNVLAGGTTCIYPIYKEKSYSIKFNAGSVAKQNVSDGKAKSNTNSSKQYSILYYTTYKFSDTDVALTGFNLQGYNTSDQQTTVQLKLGTDYKGKDIAKTFSLSETDEKNFYGVWKEKEYKIEFKGGKVKGSDNVEYTSANSVAAKAYKYYSKVKVPDTFTLDGFTATGFVKSGSTKSLVKPGQEIAITAIIKELDEKNTTTLYATWEEKKVNIVFNNGRKQASDKDWKTVDKIVEKSYPYKTKVAVPQDFAMEGFNFKGFNTADEKDAVTLDMSKNNKETAGWYVSTYGAKENTITFYGVWEEKKYSLKIEAGSKEVSGKTYIGTGSIAAKEYGYFSNITMPAGPTMRGFKLLGYSKDDQASEQKYKVGALVDIKDLIEYIPMEEKTSENTKDNTLYGVWEITSATLKFDADLGVFLSNKKRQKEIKVSVTGKPLGEYTGYEEPFPEDGYEFIYWLDADGNQYTSDTLVVGDIELTAQYKLNTTEETNNKRYAISIKNDATKGTYTGPDSFDVKLGSDIIASMSEAGVTNPIATPGYIFLGWSWTGDEADIVKTGDVYADINLKTLTAVYSENKLTVKLSAGAGEFAGGLKAKTIISTESKALNEYSAYEEPTYLGHEFRGWIDESGAEIASTSIITSDITLFAQYTDGDGNEVEDNTVYTIRIKHDSDKGTYEGATTFGLKVGSNILASMSEAGVTNPIATPGYIFLGWSWTDSADDLIKIGDLYTDSTLDSVTAIYAIKEEDVIKVVLSAGEGEFVGGDKTKIIVSNIATTLNAFTGYEEPTRDGYDFIRWLSVNGAEVSTSSEIASDTTLFASYKKVGNALEDGNYTVIIANESTNGKMIVGGVEKDFVKISMRLGDEIFATLASYSITTEANTGYVFAGWSWTGDIDNVIKAGDKYTDSKDAKLVAVWKNLLEYTVILRANTGIFKSDGSRKLKFVIDNTVSTMALQNIPGYERPVKENATFSKWVVSDTRATFSETTFVNSDLILDAIYTDNTTGEPIGDGETADDGKDATYTVMIKNEASKGTMSNAERRTIGDKEYDVAFVDFKLGDIILDKINDKGLTITSSTGNIFEGWSKTEGEEGLISDSAKYSDKDLTDIYAVYYNILSLSITLNANTGVFIDSKERTRTLTAEIKTALKDFAGYDEPIKSDGYTFDHWEDSLENIYPKTYEFNENTTIELFAIYKDNKGNTVGKNGSQDGGIKASYTVLADYDPQKSSISNTKFEVKKNAYVMQAMIDYNVYEPTEQAIGWWHKGWSFENNLATLIDETTKYSDINKTVVYAQYKKAGKWTLVLDANTGLFDNNLRVLTLENNKQVAINKFPGYHKPHKSNGFTFDRWETADGTVYKDTEKPNDPEDFPTLYAIYKDKDNKDVGKDDTRHKGSKATYTIKLLSDARGTIEGKDEFEIREGDFILATMSYAGIKDPKPTDGNYFVGWTWTNYGTEVDYENAVTADNIYKGPDYSSYNGGTVLYALYSNELLDVTLKANTGLFSDDTREKKLQVPKYQLLRAADGYEIPVKGSSTFDSWERENGASIMDIQKFKVIEPMTLKAIYRDKDGNEDGREKDGKHDGGENATYTVRVNNDDSKGQYDGAEYFDIKKGEVVYTTMKAAGVKEATPSTGYAFKGWKLGDDLISATTTYEDPNNTVLNLEYSTQTALVTFDASFGAFADGSRVKRYTLARGRILNTIDGYEEPTKKKWTFNRWADTEGATVASSSTVPDDAATYELKAMYLNRDGVEVSEDAHSHLVCGANDEIASHATNVIAPHTTKVAYLPIVSAEEFYKYINDELAKPELERKDIRMYLEEDIELDSDIAIGNNINLYLCLNGYTLRSKKLDNRKDEIGNIYITNCKENEVSITEDAEGSDTNKPLFGGNSIHMLSARGKINLSVVGRVVDVVSTASAVSKDIEFMNVSIKGNDDVLVDKFVSALGNSRVRLVDVDINGVSVTNTLIGTYEGANFYVGGRVSLEDNYTNRAIVETNNAFNIAANAALIASSNIIEKKVNGDTAILFIGGEDNKVYGDLKVSNNKLTLSDDYKKLVKVEPVVVDDTTSENSDDNDDDSLEMNKLLGMYDEEVSPAGEVGYSSAVAFTKDNIGFVVGNSTIEIYDNESVASYSDVRAGYMYQLRAKNNTKTALLQQNSGTTLSQDSVIGIAFASEDGEGFLTDSRKISQDVFKNNTFGKEEKLLNIKETDGNMELLRKRYYVEYDEGTPTTHETKRVIQSYLSDGATISETTRVRSKAIKAGHDLKLLGNDVYYTKGFDLSTYSIIDKNKQSIGLYDPRSTMSYIGDIFRDGSDIEDGDVFKAVANWDERELKSEARNLVITKEKYDELLEQAAEAAVIAEASASDIAQEEVVEENEPVYTVHYHLNGGAIAGHEIVEGTDYYEETGLSKKKQYTLLMDVEKVATESGVPRSYDFIGWVFENDDNDYTYRDDLGYVTVIDPEYVEDVVNVYAVYLPSTLKITYHLDGGVIDGFEGDTIEDTITRTLDYTLLSGPTKEDYYFTGWKIVDGDSTYSADAISAESLKSDIDAYAQYESALYSVTYKLNGGVIKGITEEGDETYVDDKANMLRDYYLYTDVTKPEHRFVEWEAVKNGATVDVIKAGDTDQSKREVEAIFEPTTWDIVYDTDGGTIEGTDGGNIIDKQEVGKEYKLFTNVTKEGWDFAYWYDETTKEKVEVISSPKGGCTYRVKAAYVLTSYDLTLHLDDETTEELKNISNKAEFVLPTDKTLENKEFENWYYKNENGEVLKITEIPKGNPENITDVYAKFDDLMTQKIVYHLGAGQSMKIGDVEAYDPGSTEDSKTVTVMKNRRENTGLVTDVKRDGWVFVGWREGRKLNDGWETLITEGGKDLSDSFTTFAPGITKAFEDVYGNEESNYYVGDIKNSEYNYYPHFIKKENLPGNGTVRVKFHVVKGEGTIYGAEKTSVNTGGYSSETVYIKNVVPIMDLSLDELTSIGLKWNLVGVYKTTAEALEDYDSRSKADSKRISVETLKENLYTDLDLYVTFEKNKNVRNITYFLDGGKIDGIPTGNSVAYDKEYFVEPGVDAKGYYDVLKGVKKEGFEFGGWYTGVWGNGTKVTDVYQFEGKNLFAYWKSKNYNVTYNLHGGKISGIVGDTYTKTYSRLSDAVLETDVTMDDYKFDGWYTQPNGKGQKYTVIPKSDSEVEDLTLHAHYIYAKYKVTYMLNGGSLVGKTLAASGSYIVTYDNREVVQLPTKKDIISEDAEFFRWEDKNGNAYQRIEEGNTEDLVLYAKYSTETVDIIFNIGDKGKAKGKIAKDGKFKETYNLASDMVLPTELSWPDTKKNVKTGKAYEEYYFDGWYKTKNYAGKPITVIPAGNPEKIEELYAKWVNGTYRIIYHMNHGYISGLSKNEFIDESYEGTVKYEDYELPTDVTRASSEFLGWYDKPQMTGTPITKLTKNPKQLVDGDVVHVYAKWKTSKYYVQYVVRQKDYADTSIYYGTYKNTVSVDNKYPYVLQNETSNTSLVGALGTTYGFDGWYIDEEFNGNEIVSVDANVTEDKTLYAKLVKLSNLDEEALAAFNARAEERTKKREDAETKRKKAIDDASKEQGTKTKEQLKKNNNFLYLLVDDIMNEDQQAAQDAINKELNSSYESVFGKLFGAIVNIVGGLLGDGPEDPTPTPAPAASPSEIVVNLADLLAYDTISEKNLGISAPKGTHLDSIIVTYIKDPFNSLVSDYTFVGSILTVGGDFSEIASVYPDHTLGVRAIFLDDKITETPATPRRPYYGGGDNGGKGGGGKGGGGRLPGTHNAIIVNPYGYDGRGSDNGASRAVNLKLQINAKIGRIATPDYTNYNVIDLAKGASGLVGLSDETWEYFPASNAFKLFASAPNGDRYYFTNGWHKRQGNSQDLWYRFDNDGLMQRGFVEEGGKIYYLNNSLSELAYMVTGYKDFAGTGYTGYFKNDGSLAIIFPTAQRPAYETKLAALPDIPIIDRTIYEKCRQFDIENTRIVKSVKTYGQSVMGNFVGYWYYLASGIRKLRLETINTELQIARFANNGWMNVYDTDNKLHSYRFDNMANLYVSTVTPEGYVVSSDGKLSGRDILLDFATIDVTKMNGYVLALTTLNTLPTNTKKLQSHLVAYDGMPLPTSPATDIWTVMDFQGSMPVMTNAVYGGTSFQPPAQPAVSAQPLKFLSTMIGDTANAFSTSEIKNAVPTLDPVGVLNPVNIVKMTKVLSNVDYVKGIKTVTELAADRKISSVYGFCMDVYNTVKSLFAA